MDGPAFRLRVYTVKISERLRQCSLDVFEGLHKEEVFGPRFADARFRRTCTGVHCTVVEQRTDPKKGDAHFRICACMHEKYHNDLLPVLYLVVGVGPQGSLELWRTHDRDPGPATATAPQTAHRTDSALTATDSSDSHPAQPHSGRARFRWSMSCWASLSADVAALGLHSPKRTQMQSFACIIVVSAQTCQWSEWPSSPQNVVLCPTQHAGVGCASSCPERLLLDRSQVSVLIIDAQEMASPWNTTLEDVVHSVRRRHVSRVIAE